MGIEKIVIGREELVEGYKKIEEREMKDNPYKSAVLSGEQLRRAINEKAAEEKFRKKSNVCKKNIITRSDLDEDRRRNEESKRKTEKKENKRNNKEDAPENHGRRYFLTALVATLGVYLANKILKSTSDGKRKEESEEPNPAGLENKTIRREMEPTRDNTDEIYEPDLEPTTAQKEISEQNIKSINEIFDFESGKRITFGRTEAITINDYWQARYNNSRNRREDENLKAGFEKGYNEMLKWVPHFKQAFVDNKVPPKYMYLAIPESHWNVNAVSRSNAVGPYQFMAGTARKMSLKINRLYDQRRDPIKSAEACAKLLRHNYDLTGDWDLALVLYNWGEGWKYLARAKENGEKISFAGYCRFSEMEMNKIIDELNDKKTVKSKKRLESLDRKKRAFIENLNYPSKFWAIEKIINEKQKQQPANPARKIYFKEITIKQPANIYFRYQIRKKDTLRKIAIASRVSVDELLFANPNYRSEKEMMKAGVIINIPNKNARPKKIKDISKEYGRQINEIRNLNPALNECILNNHAPLPDGYILRI